MGTDIHAVVQKYNEYEEKWETVFEPALPRSYKLFAVLADVRNGYGFAGVYTHEPIKPISEPRGLPKDFDYDEDKMWLGDHSFSWLLFSEIKSYDWNQKLKSGGFISPEIQKTYVDNTIPEEYCGGTNKLDYQYVEWEVPLVEQVNQGLLHLINYFEAISYEELDKFRLVFGFDS